METTGIKGKIQISQATADLINNAGKLHWVHPREDMVNAKGKGVLHTFWLNPSAKMNSSSKTSSDCDHQVAKGDMAKMDEESEGMEKQSRLIEWMVELLMEHIKSIVSILACGVVSKYFCNISWQCCCSLF
jgi:hypothetical protein